MRCTGGPRGAPRIDGERANACAKGDPMSIDKNAVRRILDHAKGAGREALTAPEARGICEAYGINIPREGVDRTGEEAAKLASDIGFPVVMKIVSPQILHKTAAGAALARVESADSAVPGRQTS